MRNLIVLTVLTMFSSAMFAQHGGGHMGGGTGGHGGMSAPHMSGSISSGSRSIGRPASPSRPFAAPARSSYRQQNRAPYRSNNGGYGEHRPDRRRRVSYGYPAAGIYPYGYPFYNLNGGLDLDDNDPNDPNLQSNNADAGYGNGQEQAYDGPYDNSYPDLSQEMTQPPYKRTARSDYAPAAPLEPKIDLIFKDGHRQQIQNYVATRTRIIVRDNGAEQNIPVASLDLPATLAANQAAGNDFSLPGNTPPG